MTKKLEVIANMAVIVTCLVAVGVMLQKAGVLPAREAGASQPQVGDSLPATWQSKAESPAPAVVAVLRSTCRFCTENMPLYRQLSATKPFIVVSTEPPETMTRYLASHGVTASRVLTVSPSAVGVPGTPTIFVVGRDGRIVIREVGRLSDTKGRELVKTVASL